MSFVPDLYPGDGLIAAAAIVLAAISITSLISLLVAQCWSRRPTVRYPILFAALISCVVTPLIATAVRVSGTSTFAWHVLPARPLADAVPQKPSVDPALAEFLATVFAADDRAASFEGRSEGATAQPTPDSLALADRGAPAIASQAAVQSINPATTTGRDMLRGAATLALVIWLLGIVVRVLRLAGSSLHVAAIWRSGRPFFAPRRRATVATQLRRLLGIRRLPNILVSDAVQSPFATGLIRGTVILPSGLIGRLSTDQLCDVLIHECAHVVRRDPTVMLLQVFCRSLFWPIPWVHWLSRELTCACEEICDNYVLSHRDPVQYAETLLHVATLVGGPHREAAWVGMLQWPGKLEMRITGLIDRERSKATRIGRLRPGLCLVALLLTSVAICGMTIRPRSADAAPEASGSSADAAPASENPPTASADAKSDQEKPAEAPATEGKPAEDKPAAEKPANEKAAEVKPAEEKPAEKSPPLAQREIEIWRNQAWGDIFKQHVVQFNDGRSGVTVKVRSFGGYPKLQEALLKAIEAGSPPDMAIVEIHQIASLAAAGQIRPLDQFIAEDSAFQPADLLPGLMVNMRYHDNVYAIPIHRSTPVLYYNKDRFLAAGLDPNHPPTTWEELRQMALSLNAPEQNQYAFEITNAPWIFESLVWGNGGELVVDGKPVFAEAAAAPLQLWADMVHLDKTARFTRGFTGDFASGRAVMSIDSTAHLNNLLSKPEFRVGVAYVPSMLPGKTAVPTGGAAAVIPAAISPERQAAAWAFINFLASAEQTAKWCQRTGYIPVRESGRALLEKQGLYDEYPEFTVGIKQLQFAREAPQIPHWDTAWSILSETLEKVVRDDAPALRTLKVSQGRVATLLETGVVPKPEPAGESK